MNTHFANFAILKIQKNVVVMMLKRYLLTSWEMLSVAVNIIVV